MKIETVETIPTDGVTAAAGTPAAAPVDSAPPSPAPDGIPGPMFAFNPQRVEKILKEREQEEAAASAPATEFADEKDALGRVFHPAKFRLKDGKPHRDAVGRFVPLGLGAKKKTEGAVTGQDASAGTPSHAPRVASSIPEDAPPPKPDLYGAAAGTIVAGLQTVLITMGQEEGILTPAEKISVQTPLEAVLRKYDVGEPPPELALLVAVGGVFVSRLSKPKTQTNVQKVRMWIAGKIAAWRGGRIAARVATS